MSDREILQSNIHNWIEMRTYSKFTAPYGVISSLEPCGKGKVRTITFGVARYLDATIFVFGKNDIRIKAAGPLSYKIDQNTYHSYDELIKALEAI